MDGKKFRIIRRGDISGDGVERTQRRTRERAFSGKTPGAKPTNSHICTFCGYTCIGTFEEFQNHVRRWIDVKAGTYRYCYDATDKVRIEENVENRPMPAFGSKPTENARKYDRHDGADK